MKKILIFAFAVVFLGLMILNIGAEGYVRSDSRWTQPYTSTGIFSATGTEIPREACEESRDFIIQIAPFGCTPVPVRSDILEEQDTPVFCQLSATKMNPMIDIDVIEDVDFKNQPSIVRGIGYHPAQGALGIKGDVNNQIMSNLGYVVIVLKKQPNESALENCEESAFGGEVCYVEGNLTAILKYDLKNAWGFGDVRYYLPEATSSDWEKDKAKYSFWKGRGYLKAENIKNDGALISIYDDFRQVVSFELDKGERSRKVHLPGFECLAGMTVKLEGVEAPERRARFNINGDFIEVKEGEDFLEGACKVNKIDIVGVLQKVKVTCRADEGSDSFWLTLSPRVKLEIGGGSANYYEVGQFLYSYEDGGDIRYAYLGYAGTPDNSMKEEGLVVYIVSIPEYKEKLEDDELGVVETIASGRWDPAQGKANILNFAGNVLEAGASVALNFWNWMVEGESYTRIKINDKDKHGGKEIRLLGYSDPQDIELSGKSKEYYDKAMGDFRDVLQRYAGTVYPEEKKISKGEEAYYEMIRLSLALGQSKTMTDLCREFEEQYPDSTWQEFDSYCSNDLKISSSGVLNRYLSIEGGQKEISFERVYEPSFSDFGAVIKIKDPMGEVSFVGLRKDERAYLKDGDEETYIQLKELGQDTAKILVSVSRGFFGNAQDFFVPTYKTLGLNNPESFKSDYSFTLTQVNLNSLAKVSLESDIDYKQSEADFSFKIGIEKRAIQLAPDKIREKVKKLNETITKWEQINERLGGVVKGLKTACIATQAVLTVKNFVDNLGGKAIARENVMKGNEGWYEKCGDLVNKNQYRNIDVCLADNADKIEQEVEHTLKLMKAQEEEIKAVQKQFEELGPLLSKNVDDVKFQKAYAESVKEEVRSALKARLDPDKDGKIIIQDDEIDINEFVDKYLQEPTAYIEDIRDLQLYSRLSGTNSLDERAAARLQVSVKNIWENGRKNIERSDFQDRLSGSVNSPRVDIYERKDTTPGVYRGDTVKSNNVFNLLEGTPIQCILFGHDEICLELKKETELDYSVVNLYYPNGTKLEKSNEISQEFFRTVSTFKAYDKKSYENKYESSFGEGVPVARYYETEPYKGYPAVVPFDRDKGWYVSIRQVLPILGEISSYDDSARLNSFYLCNVGENGMEENTKGDDICRSFVNGQTYDQFYGLKTGETEELVKRAINAVAEAHKQYGRDPITIEGWNIKIGKPAVSVPEMRCQDIYSVSDCKWLFNVCDPVICPSSRCDLGGKYPVEDVIQTGVIGGVALCLPNFIGFGGDVYVPVCLSGIHAGIDAWTKVLRGYRDCLQYNLDTGETVGICDYKHSIYQCEFFFRNGLPLVKYLIPKALELLKGESVRGGGEYLEAQSAWKNAEKSVDYFTQYYGDDAYKAFQYRSTEEVGTEVCKSYVSLVGPSSGDILDKLTEPDSPSNFHGRFEEIPFTTVTNPPISHYKVFYFIYAGKDRGAHYKVYLRGKPGTSFYQDTNTPIVVDTGYLAAGDSIDNTWDRTAPSGYQELCIVVNEQQECGFQEVSTNFAVDYISDMYLKEQALTEGIKTYKECVAGSTSFYSLLNPNHQEGLDEFLNPEVYNYYLIRVCATDNPGMGTDPNANMNNSRWVDVGYCDNTNMRCWIDKESVKEAIEILGVEEGVLSELNADYQEKLAAGPGYMDQKEFSGNITKIEGITDLEKRIEAISAILDKVFWNYHKGHLLYLRGVAYKGLAIDAFAKEFVIELTTSFAEKTLRVGQIFQFKINDKVHTLRVDKIENGKAYFTIDSRSFELGEEQKITWAIDGEENDTLEVRVISVNENVQEVFFKIRAIRKIGVGEVEGSEIVFEFDDGSGDEDLFYQFSFGEWMWSTDSREWIPVVITEDEEMQAYAKENDLASFGDAERKHQTLYEVRTLSHKFPSEKNKERIKLLQDKTYFEGLKKLIIMTMEDTGAFLGIDFDLSELKTELVDMDHNGEFSLPITGARTIKQGITEIRPVLKYDKGEEVWKWAYSVDKSWKDVSISGGFGEPIDTLITKLKNKNLYDGAEIIFELNLAEFYETLETRERVEDEEAWSRISEDEKEKVSDLEENLDRELKCEDCGTDKHWYTFSIANVCTEEECKAIDAKIKGKCTYTDKLWIFSPGGTCTSVEEVIKGPVLPPATMVTSRFSDKEFLIRIGLYSEIIERMASKHDVLPDLVRAIITQESYAYPDETDNLGSYGLMQVQIGAAKDVGMEADYDEKKYNPEYNIGVGTAYYKRLEKIYEGVNSGDDLKKITLAAYNWGMGNIARVCKDKKWENCEYIPSDVLQYVANIIAYEKEFNARVTTSFIMKTGNSDLYDEQLRDSDADLIAFLNCVNNKYGPITVTSITDNGLYEGPVTCDLDSSSQKYENDAYCVHRKDSCHYHMVGGRLQSRAADLSLNGYSKSSLTNAIKDCSEERNEDVVLCDEGDHIHISIKNCEGVGTGCVLYS